MEELKILPKKHWKQERVDYYRERFYIETGRTCPVGYPVLMKMITVYSEDRWVYLNEETGELEFEIPPMDQWTEQVDGFFKDEWASNCGFHFSYLLKQYGRFVKYEVKKEMPNTHYKCDYCKQTLRLTGRDGHRYVCPKYPKDKLY